MNDSHHLQLDLLNVENSADADATPRIRVSVRARRLAVRVYPDARVEVVVPPRVRPREVEQFLQAHREWIDSKRAAALARRPAPEPFPPATLHFGLTRETWRLHPAGDAGRARLTELPATAGGGILELRGAAAALRPALRGWLLGAARDRLGPRLAALSASTGIPYAKLSIRRQRSRWGSCSARGTISLNACLLFQRPEVVDYLIVHELTHVKHMNHSARFWQAVETHCPGWRALDRELLQGWRQVPRWIFSES
ncbi:MAG TPA: M48 family metallopeptidase [Steroidobacteraceae bacterium]|nr:M48 family metallopeptidase [Steroidobacteraceae bacterium]